jgi:hypothetical protein
LKDIEALPAHVTQSILRLKLDESGRPVEFTLASKTEAAGMLLRSLPGGVPERHEIGGIGGGPVGVILQQLFDRLYQPEVLERIEEPELVEALVGLQDKLRLIASRVVAADEAVAEVG